MLPPALAVKYKIACVRRIVSFVSSLASAPQAFSWLSSLNLLVQAKMFSKHTLLSLGLFALTSAKTITEQNPSEAEIQTARASVLPYSPVSNVKGKAFDRFVNIWIENTVRALSCGVIAWFSSRSIYTDPRRTSRPPLAMRTSPSWLRRVSYSPTITR